jgi:hypothetical protein
MDINLQATLRLTALESSRQESSSQGISGFLLLQASLALSLLRLPLEFWHCLGWSQYLAPSELFDMYQLPFVVR